MSRAGENREEAAPEKAKRAVVYSLFKADFPENKTDWILLTAASRHICINKALFDEYKEGGDGEVVETLGGSVTEVVGKGTVVLKLRNGKTLRLRDVLYVPCMIRNVVSAILLAEAGVAMVVSYDKTVFTNIRNGEFVGKAVLSSDDMFVLDLDSEILC